MTRVELLENMRRVIGFYIAGVLQDGEEPFNEHVRFGLVTLHPARPRGLFAQNRRRAAAMVYNIGETTIWLAPDDTVAQGIGLPLEPTASLFRASGLSAGPMHAYAEDGGYLFVAERMQP